MSELPDDESSYDENDLLEFPDIEGYLVQQSLGQGAYGRVFKAIDTSVGTPIAIKVLNPIASQRPDLRLRFDREVKAYYAVRDGRIVQPRNHGLITQGAYRGCPFVVMEYMDGGSFEGWLKDHPTNSMPALRVTVQILIQVCEGLTHLHESKIVHRDLKPANILLAGISKNSDGTPFPTQVRISDFGLAAFLNQSRDLSKTGMGAGTPAYMSPEQFVDGKNITPASDQYAIGVMLYQLLCSRRPWQSSADESEAPGILEAKARSKIPPPPPSKSSGKIDKQLRKVCLRCLEPKPEDRYRDTAELAEDLRKWIRGEPIVEPGHPIKWFYHRRVAQPIKRNPGRFALLVVLLGAIGVALSIVFYQLALEKANNQTLVAAARETEKYFERAANEIEINENLIEGAIWYAHAAMTASESGTDQVNLLGRLAAAWTRELPIISIPTELEIENVELSPDGKLIAVSDKKASVRVFEVSSGHQIFEHDQHDSPAYQMRFSENGKWLVTTDGKLFVSDLQEKKVAYGPFESGNPPEALWISSDGRRVAEMHVVKTTFWNCETGKVDKTTKGGYAAELNADGSVIALSEWKDTLEVFTIEAGKIIAPKLGNAVDPTTTVFDASGDLLASGGLAGEVWVWDVPTGKAIFGPEKQDGIIVKVAFLDGGKRLRVLADLNTHPTKGAMQRPSGTTQVDQIWNIESGRLEYEQLHKGVSNWLSTLSLNGEFSATVDKHGMVRVWKPSSIERRIAEFELPDLLRSLRLSEDGTQMFCHLWDEKFEVRDSRSGNLLRSIRLPAGVSPDASVSNTEKWLASYDENSQTLVIIDLKTGEVAFESITKIPSIQHFAWNAVDTKLITITFGGQCSVWNLATLPLANTAILEKQNVDLVAFDNQKNRFAVACDRGEIRFFDATTGADTGLTIHTQKRVSAIRFSANGDRLLLGYHSDYSLAELWDISTRKSVLQIEEYKGGLLEFSPDATQIVAAAHDEFRIYDARSGDLIEGPIAVPRLAKLAYSTDGSTLFAAGTAYEKQGGQLMMLDSVSGRLVGLPLPHPLALTDIALDSEPRIIAGGGLSGHGSSQLPKGFGSIWDMSAKNSTPELIELWNEIQFRTGLTISDGQIRRLKLDEWSKLASAMMMTE